jgi:ribosomal-protein-alanine N-acetyltransferase
MKAPTRIETSRLLIAQPTAADAEEMFARYASDPAVARYMAWPLHVSIDITRAFLQFSDEEWARWPAGPYVVRRRTDGQMVGGTGLAFERPDVAMTGYVFARDAWGLGYATEALGAMVEVARTTGVARLYALCHPDHQASWRVLEKSGFDRDPGWTKPLLFPNLAPGTPQQVRCYVKVLRQE